MRTLEPLLLIEEFIHCKIIFCDCKLEEKADTSELHLPEAGFEPSTFRLRE